MNFSTAPPCDSIASRIASKYRVMTARIDSGSILSPMSVEETASMKRTVTVLRHSRAGSTRTPIALPHEEQKRAPSGFSVRQLAQVVTSASEASDRCVEARQRPIASEQLHRAEE